jgi:carboxymethylenebutenolidase
MGKNIELTAADGHKLQAYRADPEDRSRGGIVVIQEVFGVNEHIRSVCDDFAAQGYTVVAPALFDRLERGVELGYDEASLARGRELRTALGWEQPVKDVAAAVTELAERGKVASVGFCWGASVTWLSATRLDVSCAVCYYGAQIVDFCQEQPRCPVLLHFGERDSLIPLENVERIRKAHPTLPMHMYPAGHGFNCDMRDDFHAESAQLARQRTLAFFAQHLG